MDRWVGLILFKDMATEYLYVEADNSEEAMGILEEFIAVKGINEDTINFYEVANFEEIEELSFY